MRSYAFIAMAIALISSLHVSASDGLGPIRCEFPSGSTKLKASARGNPDTLTWFSEDHLSTIVLARFPREEITNLAAFVDRFRTSLNASDSERVDEGYTEIGGREFWTWKVRRTGDAGEVCLRYAVTFIDERRYTVAVGSYVGDPDELPTLSSFWETVRIEEGEPGARANPDYAPRD